MKRTLLTLAGSLAAAAVVLVLPVATHSAKVGEAAPTPTSTPTVPAAPHYKCYDILGTPPPVDPVILETQFGVDEGVLVGPPTRLCLAALKNGEGDLGVPDVECYLIDGLAPGVIVNLRNQFGSEVQVVGNPDELCVPVSKAIPPQIPSQPAPAPHYECYDIGGHAALFQADLETVFGLEPGMEVLEPTRLCLPAIKNGEGGPEQLEMPHVECYTIVGPPGEPIPPLNLLNQFGLAESVPVEVPQELCVPVLKTVAAGVGGIQELPDASDGAAATTAEQDSSSAPYAAIAGIAAAAVLVVAASGWYARRRWLR